MDTRPRVPYAQPGSASTLRAKFSRRQSDPNKLMRDRGCGLLCSCFRAPKQNRWMNRMEGTADATRNHGHTTALDQHSPGAGGMLRAYGATSFRI
jgi:hypothetical protein